MLEDRKDNAFAALDILARADSVAFAKGRSDATQKPSELSDDALRMRISILEADIREAARTPRANVSALRKDLDQYEAELRSRRTRKDASGAVYVVRFTDSDTQRERSVKVYALDAAGAEKLARNHAGRGWGTLIDVKRA